jgi:hypothetical protein
MAASNSVYREAARTHGWEPAPEQLLYRIAVYVAESDAQARGSRST